MMNHFRNIQSLTINLKQIITRLQQTKFSTIFKRKILFLVNLSQFVCNRDVHTIRKQMLFLSLASLVLLLFFSFNILYTPTNIPILMINDQDNVNRTNISRITKQPIIFSKSEYFNQTHKVFFIFLFVFSFDFLIDFSPVKMSSVI